MGKVSRNQCFSLAYPMKLVTLHAYPIEKGGAHKLLSCEAGRRVQALLFDCRNIALILSKINMNYYFICILYT